MFFTSYITDRNVHLWAAWLNQEDNSAHQFQALITPQRALLQFLRAHPLSSNNIHPKLTSSDFPVCFQVCQFYLNVPAVTQHHDWSKNAQMQEFVLAQWLNDAFIKRFIVYCCTPKVLYNHVGWGGGGGLNSTPTSVQHPPGWCPVSRHCG